MAHTRAARGRKNEEGNVEEEGGERGEGEAEVEKDRPGRDDEEPGRVPVFLGREDAAAIDAAPDRRHNQADGGNWELGTGKKVTARCRHETTIGGIGAGPWGEDRQAPRLPRWLLSLGRVTLRPALQRPAIHRDDRPPGGQSSPAPPVGARAGPLAWDPPAALLLLGEFYADQQGLAMMIVVVAPFTRYRGQQ